MRLRSRRALRQWHRRHYRDERSTLEETALLSKELPAGGDFRVELGLVPDPDVNLFVLSARQRALREVDKEASQFLRRRASISGPEALYSRVRLIRRNQLRVLDSRRSRDDLYQKIVSRTSSLYMSNRTRGSCVSDEPASSSSSKKPRKLEGGKRARRLSWWKKKRRSP